MFSLITSLQLGNFYLLPPHYLLGALLVQLDENMLSELTVKSALHRLRITTALQNRSVA